MDREQMIEVMVKAVLAALKARPLIDAAQSYVDEVHAASITRSTLAALEAAGVVMVPKEATSKMIVVGASLRDIQDDRGDRNTKGIYTAMLAARPK